MNKASCLSLISNAVLIWNTVHMSRIAAQLRAAGHLCATRTSPASRLWPTPTPSRAEPTSSHRAAAPASRRNLSRPDQWRCPA
jgi:hypothetical protein